MTTKKAGRPTKMTEVTLQKLEQAFAWGCSDIEACVFAGINKSTLYDYCTKNPGFTDRKETLKTTPTMKAKMVIYKAIEDGDLATANKVIDRKEGAKVKAELTGKKGGVIHFQDLTDEQLEVKFQSLLKCIS
jgi:23S rRNA A1618 N6-methylase RlmF